MFVAPGERLSGGLHSMAAVNGNFHQVRHLSRRLTPRRFHTPLRFGPTPSGGPMAPTVDYIRQAAKLSRKIYLDGSIGGEAAPDPDFYKTLAKALEDIADGLEQVAKRRE